MVGAPADAVSCGPTRKFSALGQTGGLEKPNSAGPEGCAAHTNAAAAGRVRFVLTSLPQATAAALAPADPAAADAADADAAAPAPAVPDALATISIAGWVEYVDPETQAAYWYHPGTAASSWQEPPAVAAAKEALGLGRDDDWEHVEPPGEYDGETQRAGDAENLLRAAAEVAAEAAAEAREAADEARDDDAARQRAQLGAMAAELEFSREVQRKLVAIASTLHGRCDELEKKDRARQSEAEALRAELAEVLRALRGAGPPPEAAPRAAGAAPHSDPGAASNRDARGAAPAEVDASLAAAMRRACSNALRVEVAR
ncbi:hypothetical protein M885DRAFT_551884 [Pelagophyceae sp. CCMP2097]|nr:hypothetical protein M885DRAFT_551884 [Pelagophyceae sp. CCMP2097]